MNWKSQFRSVKITGISKVGGEDAYVVEKMPPVGDRIIDFISTKTFLLLQNEVVFSSSGIKLAVRTRFEDYRAVEGAMIPFRTVAATQTAGEFVRQVKEVQFDVEMPDSIFEAPTQK